MYYEAAVAEAELRVESMVARFRAPAAADYGPLASGGIAVGPGASIFGQDEQSREQYKHFHGWVHACVRPIAQTIASLTVCVGRQARAGTSGGSRLVRPTKNLLPPHLKARAGQIELYESHELLDLLADPNPIMTDWHLKYVTAASLEITGKAHWWLSVDNGRRVIWPIPSSWIQPKHEEHQAFASWVITPGGTGEPVTVPAEDVVYWYYPDPDNPTGATSPLQAQAHAVTADEAMQQAQTQAFRNGMWPGLALVVGDVTGMDNENQGPPLLEKEQRAALHSLVRRYYGGVVRAHEPLILDALIKDVRKISNSVQEMDFQKSGAVTKGRITQGFGVNPAVMGEIEGLNRASSATAKEHFADFCVNPKATMLSEVMTKCLGPRMARRNEKLYVYLEPYRPDDARERRAEWELMAKHGAVGRDEIRFNIGRLPAWEEGSGDVLVGATNEQPEEPKTATPVVKSEGPTGYTVEAKAKSWLKQHGDGEKEMSAVLEKLFVEQRAEVLRRLRELDGKEADTLTKSRDASGWVGLVFRPVEWYERFEEALKPALYKLMLIGAVQEQAYSRAAKAAGDDLMVQLPQEVRDEITAELSTIQTRPYWQDIHEETRRRLGVAIDEGLTNGESLYQLGVRIGDNNADGVLGVNSNTMRAFTIARTETTGALNAGHQTMQDDLARDGLIQGKEWVATIDGYTRPEHAAIAVDPKRKRVPVNANFQLTDAISTPYPGHCDLPAAQRINCRCTPVSVHVDQDQLTEEELGTLGL